MDNDPRVTSERYHRCQAPGNGARASYSYILCGWNTRSDIPLTNMPTCLRGHEKVDVLIQIAPGISAIPKRLDRSDGYVFEHSIERSFIGVEHIADFEVVRGEQISIWPVAGATNKDIELCLFGLVWGTLCHQRGTLPLHASAILTRRGITAFVGRSGAGKSTIAALMNTLGYELATDDILSVSSQPVPGAWPYLRRLKLEPEPIKQLALTPTEMVSERLDKGKYFVGPRHVAVDDWTRLERLYLIEVDPTASNVSIEPIFGAEAVHVMIDHTYHFPFIRGSGRLGHASLAAPTSLQISAYIDFAAHHHPV